MIRSEFLSQEEASHGQSLSAQTKQRWLVRLCLPKMLCDDREGYDRTRALGVRPEACLRHLDYIVVSRCGQSHRQTEPRVRAQRWRLKMNNVVRKRVEAVPVIRMMARR